MTWRPHPLPPVPEATAAIVKAAFPKGNLYVALRAEFGTLYPPALFADLYADRGHPVKVAPWRLALVMVMHWTCSHDTGHIWEEILPRPSESMSRTLKDLERQAFTVFWGMIHLGH
jgi:hypothetical protein